jgi:hypothetical protein
VAEIAVNNLDLCLLKRLFFEFEYPNAYADAINMRILTRMCDFEKDELAQIVKLSKFAGKYLFSELDIADAIRRLIREMPSQCYSVIPELLKAYAARPDSTARRLVEQLHGRKRDLSIVFGGETSVTFVKIVIAELMGSVKQSKLEPGGILSVVAAVRFSSGDDMAPLELSKSVTLREYFRLRFERKRETTANIFAMGSDDSDPLQYFDENLSFANDHINNPVSDECRNLKKMRKVLMHEYSEYLASLDDETDSEDVLDPGHDFEYDSDFDDL